MPLLKRSFVLVLFATLCFPSESHAQWVTTVASTIKEIPIGSCAAVRLEVFNKGTTDIPRRPGGAFVTIADFDMSVRASDGKAVAGYWIDQYHYYACSCQAGTVGARGEITATYPASTLKPALVASVAPFNVTGAFTIGKPAGKTEMKACAAALTKPDSRVTSTTPLQSPTTAPVPQPIGAAPTTTTKTPVSTAPAPAAPIPSTGTPTTRVSIPTTTTQPIPSTGTPLPVTSTGTTTQAIAPAPAAPQPIATTTPATTTTKTPVSTGPIEDQTRAPQNLGVYGNPAEVRVQWFNQYPTWGSTLTVSNTVERWKTSNPDCCKRNSGTIQKDKFWLDPVTDTGSFTYRVRAVWSDGRTGVAQTVYTPPLVQAPKNFAVAEGGRDTLVLTWSKVPGASSYIFGGPPSNVAVKLDTATTRVVVTGTELGPAVFKVATMYEGETPGIQQTSPFATVATTGGSHRFRVIAESIKVTSETVDHQMSEDGMYDEIYVASVGMVVDRLSGAFSNLQQRASSVHGDVTTFTQPIRQQAGTASANGGIRGGDFISPIYSAPAQGFARGTADMVLWEGDLRTGLDDLVLHPTIWESDELDSRYARKFDAPCRGYFCSWAEAVRNTSIPSTGAIRDALKGSTAASVEANIVWLSSSASVSHLELQRDDRPIGLENDPSSVEMSGVTGMYRDRVVVLSREKIEAALAAGNNKVTVRFWDRWKTTPSTIPYLNGDYTLTIRIDRVK